jgi:hypothetical protein
VPASLRGDPSVLGETAQLHHLHRVRDRLREVEHTLKGAAVNHRAELLVSVRQESARSGHGRRLHLRTAKHPSIESLPRQDARTAARKPAPSRQVGLGLETRNPLLTNDSTHPCRRNPKELLSTEGHRSLEAHALALRPHKELEPVGVDAHRPNVPAPSLAGGRRGGSTSEQLRFDHLVEAST